MPPILKEGTSAPDTLYGTAQDDVILGYARDDVLYGLGGNDIMFGGDGQDALYGASGEDDLWGNNGNDGLNGGPGADKLHGGAGTDTARYNWSSSSVRVDLETGTGKFGDAEGDQLESIENLHGSAFDDILYGNGGANQIIGNSGEDYLDGRGGKDHLLGQWGDDRIRGGAGADTIHGGDGNDTALYSLSLAAVTVNLSSASGKGGDAEGDLLLDIENLVGSSHNDTLTGDDGANVLNGALGTDTLTGGAGADTFAFEETIANGLETGIGRAADRILDFSQSDGDRIDLSDLGAFAFGDKLVCTFIAEAAFSGQTGEIRYAQTASNTVVSGDRDGNGIADFEILVTGSITFTSNDFIL